MLQFFGAVIAAATISIAFFQWRINTAHLFDRLAQRPNQNIDAQIDRLNRINAFYTEIDRMFVPYMRIDQKMRLWWCSALKVRAMTFLTRRS